MLCRFNEITLNTSLCPYAFIFSSADAAFNVNEILCRNSYNSMATTAMLLNSNVWVIFILLILRVVHMQQDQSSFLLNTANRLTKMPVDDMVLNTRF